MEAARTDLLRVQTILNEQLDIVEGRLRAAQVAYLLDRPLLEGAGSESSAGAFHDDPQRAAGAHSCSTKKEVPDEGTLMPALRCEGILAATNTQTEPVSVEVRALAQFICFCEEWMTCAIFLHVFTVFR